MPKTMMTIMMMMMMIMTDPFTTNLVVKGPVAKGSVVKGATSMMMMTMMMVMSCWGVYYDKASSGASHSSKIFHRNQTPIVDLPSKDKN